MAAMAVISGALPRAIASPDGILNWNLIQPAISPKIYYRAQTGLITLENTHNMAGGTVYTASQIRDICQQAHTLSIRVHMDGARIFNAATALGESVQKLCEPCDSVMFCLSKGLGAPVGSMLAGSKAFVEQARSVRKLLGGGMRQSGVLAAAGLIALEKMPSRLHQDHANARLLAETLGRIDILDVNVAAVRTNIVVVGIGRTGYDSTQMSGLLKSKGVLVGTVDASTLRLLTHFDVDRSRIEETGRLFHELLARRS
jgi:threonine aldolase